MTDFLDYFEHYSSAFFPPKYSKTNLNIGGIMKYIQMRDECILVY